MKKQGLSKKMPFLLFRMAFLTGFLMSGTLTFAGSPDFIVSGTVTSAMDEEPLIGVTIYVKGASMGTTTAGVLTAFRVKRE